MREERTEEDTSEKEPNAGRGTRGVRSYRAASGQTRWGLKRPPDEATGPRERVAGAGHAGSLPHWFPEPFCEDGRGTRGKQRPEGALLLLFCSPFQMRERGRWTERTSSGANSWRTGRGRGSEAGGQAQGG